MIFFFAILTYLIVHTILFSFTRLLILHQVYLMMNLNRKYVGFASCRGNQQDDN